MIPPAYAKGVTVKNTTGHPLKIKVWFGSDEQEAQGNAKICEDRVLAPQEKVEIEEQTYDMGSWTAVAALYAVEVEAVPAPGSGAVGAARKSRFTPKVTEIVNVLDVEVREHPSEGTLHVTAL
ncbi:hypothetical protein ATCC90586_004569 [Pythium insidiosum]|nr:hypothetical protein ATCC90586_004569 [Pythium insidiosum]